MKIRIWSIPHKEHRYETVGDWWVEPDGEVNIRVSEMGDWRYELLVAVHELVEQSLCKHRGITQQSVDDFDMKFEQNRIDDEGEPGWDIKAPYYREHVFAELVERLLAKELDVHWLTYDDRVMGLSKE